MSQPAATAPKPRYDAIWPGLEAGVPKPLMPYSPAIRAGDWLFVAGTIASDFKTGIAPEVREAMQAPHLRSELELQSHFVLRTLASTIRAAGFDIQKDMTRIWQWFVADRPSQQAFAAGDHWTGLDLAPYLRARTGVVGHRSPASSSLGVRELLCYGTQIEVEMICLAHADPLVEIVGPADPVAATSGDVAGVRRGDWIFLSAQNASGPVSGAPASPEHWWLSPVEQQLDRVLEKLSSLAAAAGGSLAGAVKAEVYIGHPRDFAAVDAAWRRWFPQDPPARVVVPYMGMGVRGNRVEVALTLLADGTQLRRRTIETSDAPEPFGHEPQAVLAGDLLFLSTQMPFDGRGRLAEGAVRRPEFPWYGLPAQAQMRYMMKNVAGICAAAGTSVEMITRRVCYHSEFEWFAESIQEWANWFPGDKPASTTLRIGGPLVVPGATTLLDLTAYAPD